MGFAAKTISGDVLECSSILAPLLLQQVRDSATCIEVLIVCGVHRIYDIKQELERAGAHHQRVRVHTACGNAPLSRSRDMLRNACPNILIGAPGRVGALVQDGSINLGQLRWLVLDAEGRQLPLHKIPQGPQSAVTHASAPVHMMNVAISGSVASEVHSSSIANRLPSTFSHYFLCLESAQKTQKLVNLLESLSFEQAVVLVRSTKVAQVLGESLARDGFPIVTVNDDLEPAICSAGLQAFKEFQKRILVADGTSVREIHAHRADVIVHYDVPQTPDQLLPQLVNSHKLHSQGRVLTLLESAEEELSFSEICAGLALNATPLPDTVCA